MNAAREAARADDGRFGLQHRTSPGDDDRLNELVDPDGMPVAPAEAAVWASVMSEPADAQGWLSHRFTDPYDAQQWAQRGFTPSVAVMWRAARFAPAQAAAWARSRFTPKTAVAYAAFGFTPKTAADWREEGGPAMETPAASDVASPEDSGADVAERHRWASIVDQTDPTAGDPFNDVPHLARNDDPRGD